MKKLIFFNLIMNLLFLTGCNIFLSKSISTDQIPKNNSANNPSQNSNEYDSFQKINFDIVKKISLASCYDCHAGTSKTILIQSSDYQKQINILKKVILEETMPKVSYGYNLLDSCQKDLFLKWLELGAPENSDFPLANVSSCNYLLKPPTDVPVEPPIAQLPLNYKNIYEQILRPKCVKCHNPDHESDASTILFFPYNEISEAPRRWKSPASESKIIRSVTRTDQDRMPPPPPEGAEPLTSQELEFLSRWIDAGVPE